MLMSVYLIGFVQTLARIDREKYPNGFTLTITASDHGTPPLKSSSKLMVNISDVNDNAPVFERFSYRGTVYENEVGSQAAVVNATDEDNGLAGEITYSITGMFM